MKKDKDEMRAEYKRSDFTSLERGKFHKEAVKGTSVVLLNPVVAKAFPTSESVNEALLGLLTLAAEHEGYRLADLFAIKRGLATGDNSFFIIDEERVKELDLPARFLRPVLPSSRHIKDDEILSDAKGIPLLSKRQFLIDCDIPEHEIKRDYPNLWAYLETGLESVATAYLCKSRKYWYAQEKREAAPIVCTYLGRSDHARRPLTTSGA